MIVLELGASVLTRNRRHFERIHGLRLEGPG
jgi:predicted nucleic acid-binding protein